LLLYWILLCIIYKAICEEIKMKELTIQIQNDSVADKLIWMLKHFHSEGVLIKETSQYSAPSDVEVSITNAVNELNLLKEGKLQAKPVKDLLSAL